MRRFVVLKIYKYDIHVSSFSTACYLLFVLFILISLQSLSRHVQVKNESGRDFMGVVGTSSNLNETPHDLRSLQHTYSIILALRQSNWTV